MRIASSRKWLVGIVAIKTIALLVLFLGVPSVWAADGDPTVEAATVEAPAVTSLDQIRAAINTETDPELKAMMEQELRGLESGELTLKDLDLIRHEIGPELGLGAPPVEGILPVPVVDGGGPGTAGTILDKLSPEAQAKMETIFSEVETGRANGTLTEQQAHELAEQAGEIAARDLGMTREELDTLFEQQVRSPRDF